MDTQIHHRAVSYLLTLWRAMESLCTKRDLGQLNLFLSGLFFFWLLASAAHLPSNYRVFHSCLIQLENCCCFPPGNRFSCCSCTARQGKNNLPGFKTGQSYRFPWCWLYSQQIPGLVSSPLTKATQLADERREANNVIILQQTPALDNCLNSTWHCRGLNVCGQGILMN